MFMQRHYHVSLRLLVFSICRERYFLEMVSLCVQAMEHILNRQTSIEQQHYVDIRQIIMTD